MEYRVTLTYVVCVDADDEQRAISLADDWITAGADEDFGELIDAGAVAEEVGQ